MINGIALSASVREEVARFSSMQNPGETWKCCNYMAYYHVFNLSLSERKTKLKSSVAY